MKVLIIDNYDSFTYNLYQYVGEILLAKGKPFTVNVIRNDKITLDEIKKRQYDRIIISPGPGDPGDTKYFGVCAEVITQLGKTTPVLGVCLGMQGIAHYFGGKVIRAKEPMHGKISMIQHDAKGVFHAVPQNIEVMRYHSLVADSESLPECLEITAVVSPRHPELVSGSLDIDSRFSHKGTSFSEVSRGNDNVEIMGLRHKAYPIEGIQFHPESFATEAGKIMLENFLNPPPAPSRGGDKGEGFSL